MSNTIIADEIFRKTRYRKRFSMFVVGAEEEQFDVLNDMFQRIAMVELALDAKIEWAGALRENCRGEKMYEQWKKVFWRGGK